MRGGGGKEGGKGKRKTKLENSNNNNNNNNNNTTTTKQQNNRKKPVWRLENKINCALSIHRLTSREVNYLWCICEVVQPKGSFIMPSFPLACSAETPEGLHTSQIEYFHKPFLVPLQRPQEGGKFPPNSCKFTSKSHACTGEVSFPGHKPRSVAWNYDPTFDLAFLTSCSCRS